MKRSSLERYGVKSIVDSQVHIWAADTPQRPWPKKGDEGNPHKPYPVNAEAMLLQMDLAGVQRAIIVPPSWPGLRNELALEAAEMYPDRFAVMGRLDVSDPASRGRMASWRVQPGMLGIRLFFSPRKPEECDGLRRGDFNWVWEEAEIAGIPITIMLPALADAPQILDSIAGAHPELKLCVDHLNTYLGEKNGLTETVPKLMPLAKHPNIALKASCLPRISNELYPFSDVHDTIKMCFDTFGPKRVFWGSDITHLPCSYCEAIKLFIENLPWLKGNDLEWVMGRGACEWFGWPLESDLC